jgi:hypothetical protein
MFKEHDDTGDKLEHAYFCYLADKFERDSALLDIPLKTIERWRKRGTWGLNQLARWEGLIEAAKLSSEGLMKLVSVLRADDEDTRFFKGFAPFPGVLDESEKDQFICASRH